MSSRGSKEGIAIPTIKGTIAEFKSAVAADTPFLLFWRAQNALYAMYGMDQLDFNEVQFLFKRTYCWDAGIWSAG